MPTKSPGLMSVISGAVDAGDLPSFGQDDVDGLAFAGLDLEDIAAEADDAAADVDLVGGLGLRDRRAGRKQGGCRHADGGNGDQEDSGQETVFHNVPTSW
jgi:hypothetical protein